MGESVLIREIKVNLPEEEDKLLEQEAARRGISLDAYVEALVLKDATRLWHIERCKPRIRGPVGRPGKNEQTEQWVRQLESYFNTLREHKPNLWAAGAYEALLLEWQGYRDRQEWNKLGDFVSRKPWMEVR